MLADPRATRWMTDFMGQWLLVRNTQTVEPDPARFPDFDDTLREAMARETELFFESQVRDDRSVLDLLQRRLHVPERAARRALRHPQSVRQPLPARRPSPTRRGRVCSGTASVLTVTSYARPDVGRAAGQMGAGDAAGRAAAAAAAQRAAAEGERRQEQADVAARADGAASKQSGLRELPCPRWIRWGSRWRTSIATGRWRENDSGAPINSAITLRRHDRRQPEAFREALAEPGRRSSSGPSRRSCSPTRSAGASSYR